MLRIESPIRPQQRPTEGVGLVLCGVHKMVPGGVTPHCQTWPVKCGHCLVSFHDQPVVSDLGKDATSGWRMVRRTCPSCGRFNIDLVEGVYAPGPGGPYWHDKRSVSIYPKTGARPVPPEVSKDIADDFTEAAIVLRDSPKASAALSRRCLQSVLREAAGVKHQDLAKEIQEVLDSGTLPTYLAEAIDAVRNVGNFAAHPIKSQHSGEVLPVEPGEAEWTLDVLELLFDFYYVQPAVLRAKRDALNTKLSEAGKQQMKGSI